MRSRTVQGAEGVVASAGGKPALSNRPFAAPPVPLGRFSQAWVTATLRQPCGRFLPRGEPTTTSAAHGTLRAWAGRSAA